MVPIPSPVKKLCSRLKIRKLVGQFKPQATVPSGELEVVASLGRAKDRSLHTNDNSATLWEAITHSQSGESPQDAADATPRSVCRSLSSLHPVMLLPIEILGYIFELACQPTCEPGGRSLSFDILVECRQTRLAIAWSCSRFRNALLETPRAWCHIPILINGLQISNPFVSLELARGRMCSVHYYLFIEEASPVSYGEFLQHILHSAQGRLQTFLVESKGPFLLLFDLLSSEQILSTLKNLDITIFGKHPDSTVESDLRAACRLETLSIKYVTWGGGLPTPPSLMLTCGPGNNLIQMLTIDGNISVDDTIHLISYCHDSIETLRWLLFPRVPSSHQLPLSPCILQLPHLKALQLEVPAPFSFLAPSRFDMPNLGHLILNDWMEWADGVDAGIPVLPSLQTCTLYTAHWRQNALLVPFFHANYTVRYIRTAAYMHDVANFFLSAGSPRGGELLPNLERLHFVVAAGDKSIIESWLTLIRSRQHPFIVCCESIYDSLQELLVEFSDIVVVDSHDLSDHPPVIAQGVLSTHGIAL
ncbi:hypothetical protein DL93DRAFT_2169720 [Clavulina sp. PMI_390]|nr:hypothetical protein DL93DRAFT_2169720 [Clavulina sp. PMI_390]